MEEIIPNKTINGITVMCAYDELVDIVKVIPNPRNPNKHSDRQVDVLARIIKSQGWRAPITVSMRSGFIVRGHGRLLAAQKLGVQYVPVDYQDYENEAQEWADLIADNRVAELSERDGETLKDLLQELKTGDFDIDLDLTGYTDEEIQKMLSVELGDEVDFKEFDESVSKDVKIVRCPNCGTEFPV